MQIVKIGKKGVDRLLENLPKESIAIRKKKYENKKIKIRRRLSELESLKKVIKEKELLLEGLDVNRSLKDIISELKKIDTKGSIGKKDGKKK